MNIKLFSSLAVKVQINGIGAEGLIAYHGDNTLRIRCSALHCPHKGDNTPVFALVQQRCLPLFYNLISNNTCSTPFGTTKIRQLKFGLTGFDINAHSNTGKKLYSISVNHLEFVLLEVVFSGNISFDISANAVIVNVSILIGKLHNKPVAHIRRHTQIGKILTSLRVFQNDHICKYFSNFIL